jgi:hypothetical protein
MPSGAGPRPCDALGDYARGSCISRLIRLSAFSAFGSGDHGAKRWAPPGRVAARLTSALRFFHLPGRPRIDVKPPGPCGGHLPDAHAYVSYKR